MQWLIGIRPTSLPGIPDTALLWGTANAAHLTVVNSTNLKNIVHWASHHLYAVRHKDTEPRSVYALSSLDPARPVVDFDKFFDGESLMQEDLVM